MALFNAYFVLNFDILLALRSHIQFLSQTLTLNAVLFRIDLI